MLELDDAKFAQIATMTVGRTRIDEREARVIIAIAQLAAWIDLDEAPEENRLLDALIRCVCALGRVEPRTIRPLSPVPTDREERAARLARFAEQLVDEGICELAYVVAYLVVTVDLELAPIESKLLDELRSALAIPEARARELVGLVAQLVTPPEQPAHGTSLF